MTFACAADGVVQTRLSTGAPGTTKTHPHHLEAFRNSHFERSSSVDLYADIPTSCSVSGMSCSVASGVVACGQPQQTPFDSQNPFNHASGPAAVGGYERYSRGVSDSSRGHVSGHTRSGFGAVSCAAGAGMCHQPSMRSQSCGTSFSGVTCGTCAGSISCHSPDTSHGRCNGRGQRGRPFDSMGIVWLGRAVLAGGVALMLLQGVMPRRQRKTNKGVRLRTGPVLNPETAPDYSDMEEIILYPPEVLSDQMGNPKM